MLFLCFRSGGSGGAGGGGDGGGRCQPVSKLSDVSAGHLRPSPARRPAVARSALGGGFTHRRRLFFFQPIRKPISDVSSPPP